MGGMASPPKCSRVFLRCVWASGTLQGVRGGARRRPVWPPAQVVMNLDTGRSKGFGFVKFEDPRDADDAITEADGKAGPSRLRAHAPLSHCVRFRAPAALACSAARDARARRRADAGRAQHQVQHREIPAAPRPAGRPVCRRRLPRPRRLSRRLPRRLCGPGRPRRLRLPRRQARVPGHVLGSAWWLHNKVVPCAAVTARGATDRCLSSASALLAAAQCPP